MLERLIVSRGRGRPCPISGGRAPSELTSTAVSGEFSPYRGKALRGLVSTINASHWLTINRQ